MNEGYYDVLVRVRDHEYEDEETILGVDDEDIPIVYVILWLLILEDLEKEGLVASIVEGKKKKYFLLEKGHKAIRYWEEHQNGLLSEQDI